MDKSDAQESGFEYEGLKVDHASNWSARDYLNRTQCLRQEGHQTAFEAPQKARIKPQGLGNAGRQTSLYDHQKRQAELQNATQQDWRSRGLTNNKIIDY